MEFDGELRNLVVTGWLPHIILKLHKVRDSVDPKHIEILVNLMASTFSRECHEMWWGLSPNKTATLQAAIVDLIYITPNPPVGNQVARHVRQEEEEDAQPRKKKRRILGAVDRRRVKAKVPQPQDGEYELL